MATLRHHWRFNGNLADSVGEAHFGNSSDDSIGTLYTANKDGIVNRALRADVEPKAFWTSSQNGFEGKYTISLWTQRPEKNGLNASPVFAWGGTTGYVLSNVNNIRIQLYSSIYFELAYNITTSINSWTHVLIMVDTEEGIYKVYFDGLYKTGGSSANLKNNIPAGAFCLNCGYTTALTWLGNRANTDEVTVFDGWLTDGGIAPVINTPAGGEVAALFNNGMGTVTDLTFSEATIRHYWKFDGNLKDSVGTAHFVNSNAPNMEIRYTKNKDDEDNKALNNNIIAKSYSSNVVDGFSGKVAMSAWVQRSSSSSSSSSGGGVVCLFNIFGIGVEPTTVYFYNGTYWRVNIPNHIKYGDWFHVLLQIDRTTGELKGYINSVLVIRIATSGYTGDLPASAFFLNYSNLSPNQSYINKSNSDEIKVFDGWLTDGGVTTAGQQATGEVLDLYLEGVNNIKRPTITQISNITYEGCDVSWI